MSKIAAGNVSFRRLRLLYLMADSLQSYTLIVAVLVLSLFSVMAEHLMQPLLQVHGLVHSAAKRRAKSVVSPARRRFCRYVVVDRKVGRLELAQYGPKQVGKRHTLGFDDGRFCRCKLVRIQQRQMARPRRTTTNGCEVRSACLLTLAPSTDPMSGEAIAATAKSLPKMSFIVVVLFA